MVTSRKNFFQFLLRIPLEVLVVPPSPRIGNFQFLLRIPLKWCSVVARMFIEVFQFLLRIPRMLTSVLFLTSSLLLSIPSPDSTDLRGVGPRRESRFQFLLRIPRRPQRSAAVRY